MRTLRREMLNQPETNRELGKRIEKLYYCMVSTLYQVPALVNLSTLLGRNSTDAALTVYATKPNDNALAICVYFISIEREVK